MPVRIYWDADNIRFTKRVYKAFARLLGDVQVRYVAVCCAAVQLFLRCICLALGLWDLMHG